MRGIGHMRRFVVSCLKMILDLGFWLTVLGSAFAGFLLGSSNSAAAVMLGGGALAGFVGAVIGLIGGFLMACLIFGMFYLVFQIEENTRRGGEFFEALGRRMVAREQAPAAVEAAPET
jgi:hypothetical protein